MKTREEGGSPAYSSLCWESPGVKAVVKVPSRVGNAPWAAEEAMGKWPFCGLLASALSHCRGLLANV